MTLAGVGLKILIVRLKFVSSGSCLRLVGLFALQLAQHLTPMEKLTAILAAITHDVDHPGVNQAFLIATSNPLATLYAVRVWCSTLRSHPPPPTGFPRLSSDPFSNCFAQF